MSHLEKWVKIGKNCHTLKKWLLLSKCVTLGDYAPHGKMNYIQKWETIEKMCHIWKNGSHLKIWVTLVEVDHTWKSWSHFDK